MKIVNPLAHSEVVIEDEVDASLIIEAYARDYKIDVSEYFVDISSIKIYKCLETGYRFFYPHTLVGREDLYVKLQEYPQYYGLNYEHEIADKFIASNQIVLEIGCGRGYFLDKLNDKGARCVGLELNQSAISFARKKGLDVFSEDLNEHSKQNFEKYDVVCSFQVLEHIPNVGEVLQSSIDALKVGGLLIIGVPNSNPYLYGHEKYHTLNNPPHHMGLWDIDSLTNLQKIFNLRLKNLFIEPLQTHDYEKYFKLQCEHFQGHNRLIGFLLEFLLLKLRPSRLRLQIQALIAKKLSGRNLLAVFEKIN